MNIMRKSSCNLSEDEVDGLQYGLDKLAETMFQESSDEELVRGAFERLKESNPQKFGKYVDKLIKALDDIHSVYKELHETFGVGEYDEL